MLTFRFAVACPAALLAFTPSEDALRFAPQAESEVRRTLTTTANMELTEISAMVNGEDQPLPDEFELVFDYEEELVILDRFGATEDDRVTGLQRSFESLHAARSYSGPEGTQDAELSSELGASAIVFNWDGDEEAYSIAFAEDEDGDEDLLEDLEFDMDASFLLPPGEVEEGESWRLEPGLVEQLADLAGDLRFEEEDEDEDEEDMMEELIEEAGEQVDGDFTATFVGFREEDEVRVAEIRLEADVSGTAEGSADIDEEGPDGTNIEGTQELAVELNNVLTGTLLWNVDAGRMHSLEASTELTIQNNISASLDFGQFQLESLQEMTFEGVSELTVSVEAP